MFKLRQTWSDLLPARKLYALDVRVNQKDPAWPVTPLAADTPAEPKSPSSIHVNPKFLQKTGSRSKPVRTGQPPAMIVVEITAQDLAEPAVNTLFSCPSLWGLMLEYPYRVIGEITLLSTPSAPHACCNCNSIF